MFAPAPAADHKHEAEKCGQNETETLVTGGYDADFLLSRWWQGGQVVAKELSADYDVAAQGRVRRAQHSDVCTRNEG